MIIKFDSPIARNLLLSELKGYNIHVVGDADSKSEFVKYHNVIGDRISFKFR